MDKYARRYGATMNRTKVIVLMTIAVFFVVTVLTMMFFKGMPPWPLLATFAISHLFFCIVISRVKPYRGPYNKPSDEISADRWRE